MKKKLAVAIQLLRGGKTVWIEFPAPLGEVSYRMGVDFIEEEEYIVVDSTISSIPEFTSIQELNYLATQLEEVTMSPALFEAIAEKYRSLTEVLEHLNEWTVVEAKNSETFGRWVLKEGLVELKLPAGYVKYFDYHAFGQDCLIKWGAVRADGYYAFIQRGV